MLQASSHEQPPSGRSPDLPPGVIYFDLGMLDQLERMRCRQQPEPYARWSLRRLRQFIEKPLNDWSARP
jgi:hypothetical protein